MGGNMLDTIKEMVISKKFMSFVGGSLVCAVLTFFHAPEQLVTTIASLTGAYVLGQGMADFGKNKPR